MKHEPHRATAESAGPVSSDGATISADQRQPQRASAAPVRRPRYAFLAQLGRRGRAKATDYVYQIIIVVIGVFLGITFEGMASDRDRTQKANAALAQLVVDLERDDADMSRIIETQHGQVRDFSEIAQWLLDEPNSESARIDSLLQKVLSSYTVYPRRGLYASMISAGQIALLPESVSGSIVNLYENTYARLAANGEHYDFSLERDFFPAYAHAWDPTQHALIVANAAERTRFRNVVLLMRAWSAYYADLVTESQVQLRAVMAEIELREQ